MRVFKTLDEVSAAIGEELGTSEWLTIDQERVNVFADATGDHQWIHVDADQAKAGPFGTTIAHGYLTLALIPMLGKQVYTVHGTSMGINYGLGKVRFPSVVPVGSRVRASVELADVVDKPQGKQVTVRTTVEIEGGDKPACVAESIALYVP